MHNKRKSAFCTTFASRTMIKIWDANKGKFYQKNNFCISCDKDAKQHKNFMLHESLLLKVWQQMNSVHKGYCKTKQVFDNNSSSCASSLKIDIFTDKNHKIYPHLLLFFSRSTKPFCTSKLQVVSSWYIYVVYSNYMVT